MDPKSQYRHLNLKELAPVSPWPCCWLQVTAAMPMRLVKWAWSRLALPVPYPRLSFLGARLWLGGRTLQGDEREERASSCPFCCYCCLAHHLLQGHSTRQHMEEHEKGMKNFQLDQCTAQYHHFQCNTITGLRYSCYILKLIYCHISLPSTIVCTDLPQMINSTYKSANQEMGVDYWSSHCTLTEI